MKFFASPSSLEPKNKKLSFREQQKLSTQTNAMAAFKRYNNVQLEWKPMKLEIMETNVATPAAPSAASGTFGSSNVASGGQGWRIWQATRWCWRPWPWKRLWTGKGPWTKGLCRRS